MFNNEYLKLSVNNHNRLVLRSSSNMSKNHDDEINLHSPYEIITKSLHLKMYLNDRQIKSLILNKTICKIDNTTLTIEVKYINYKS